MTKEQIQTAVDTWLHSEDGGKWPLEVNDSDYSTFTANDVKSYEKKAFIAGFRYERPEFTQLLEAAREAKKDLQKLVTRLEELQETMHDKALLFSAELTISDLSSALKNIEG